MAKGGGREIDLDDNTMFYGVRPDAIAKDGDPIFDVDDDDYIRGVQRDPGQKLGFSNPKVKKAIRKANYKPGMSLWLRNKTTGKSYKYVHPKKSIGDK